MDKKETEKKEEVVIGIDLGTTYSCVAIWRNGKPEVVPNEFGERTTPSVISFDKNEILISNAAKNKNENIIYDAKRLIGRSYDDKEIQEDMKYWPFKLNKDDNNKPLYEVEYNGKTDKFYPEEISAMILLKLKKNAEDFYGHEINAIITVPAYFNDLQRQSTKNAGKIAGLNVMRIINEPTAASIAYNLNDNNNNEKKKYILVFDFGGGTLDVTILLLDKNIFDVKSTCGNSHLGGEDLDNELMKYCINEFKNETNIDISNNKKAINRLKNECEIVKIELSKSFEATLNIDYIIKGKEINIEITLFEDMSQKYFDKCFEILEQALKDAKIKKEEIEEIILVGGSTKIPKIKEMIKEYFNKEPCDSINPDEVVAIGATIQAAITNNIESENKTILLDVTPLSIGVKVSKGKMEVIIPRNTTIPCEKIYKFKSIKDNQEKFIINLYQGENKYVKDNIHLGKLQFEINTPKPKGKTIIEIIFTLDINGILEVTAKELGSENIKNLIIESIRLSEEKIDELTKKIGLEIREELRRTCELYLEKGSENQKNKANEILDWIKTNNNLDKTIYQDKLKEMKDCH